MLTGGKIGDIIGRRRAFVDRPVIYACGSGLTAVSQTVAQLTLGWSILEGIGAALVLPAHGGADRRQLRGQGTQGRLRRDRRRRRGRDRDRPDPRRLGDDRAHLAGRLRRRGRDRRRHPRHDPLRRRRAADGAQAAGSMSSARSCRPRVSAPIVLGVLQSTTWGLVQPKDSPIEPFGLLADPVRHRGRRRAAVGLRHVAAAPGADRAATRWCTSTCCRIAAAAGRPARPVLAEPHPHGRVLHDPAVPPAGPRAQRARDGHQDAARLDRDVRRRRRRVTPVEPLPRPDDHAGRAWRPPSSPVVAAARDDPARTSPTRRSRCRWPLLGVGHGPRRLAARPRRPVVGRRLGPRRGRRSAVHGPAARAPRSASR